MIEANQRQTPIVYIASAFEEQQTCRIIRDTLSVFDIYCSSSWLSTESALTRTVTDADRYQRATQDLIDIATADVLVAYNPSDYARSGTGGRHVELGYAVAKRMPVVLIGARTNVFHYLPSVRYVRTPIDYAFLSWVIKRLSEKGGRRAIGARLEVGS